MIITVWREKTLSPATYGPSIIYIYVYIYGPSIPRGMDNTRDNSAKKRHVKEKHWNPSKLTHFNTGILTKNIGQNTRVDMCQFTRIPMTRLNVSCMVQYCSQWICLRRFIGIIWEATLKKPPESPQTHYANNWFRGVEGVPPPPIAPRGVSIFAGPG